MEADCVQEQKDKCRLEDELVDHLEGKEGA